MDKPTNATDADEPNEKPSEEKVQRVLTPTPADAPQPDPIPSNRGPKFVDEGPPRAAMSAAQTPRRCSVGGGARSTSQITTRADRQQWQIGGARRHVFRCPDH
jgi:hypothetical protein